MRKILSNFVDFIFEHASAIKGIIFIIYVVLIIVEIFVTKIMNYEIDPSVCWIVGGILFVSLLILTIFGG